MTKVRNREVKPASVRRRARRAHSGKSWRRPTTPSRSTSWGWRQREMAPRCSGALRPLKTPRRLSSSTAWDLARDTPKRVICSA